MIPKISKIECDFNKKAKWLFASKEFLKLSQLPI